MSNGSPWGNAVRIKMVRGDGAGGEVREKRESGRRRKMEVWEA